LLGYGGSYCKIGDLELSQPANDTVSNDEIYGVIPYIAPEIFKGSAFSKESDIYSLGMIMWELTTGCKPFANIEHDISLIHKIVDGVRPEITEDTPQFYADLMKRCWDSDPKKRPSISEFEEEIFTWPHFIFKQADVTRTIQFYQAELKRKKLIESKKLGPKFNEKPHPKAIYTSRSLSSYISKYSSINSSSNGMYYYTILINIFE
jgi:serine/threonine protein kinase